MAVPRSSFWQWGELDRDYHSALTEYCLSDPEEAEREVASNSDALHGARRVWAWVSHVVCLHRSTLKDWGITFPLLSGLIRRRRDGAPGRENDNAQARQHK